MSDLERLILQNIRSEGFVPSGVKAEDGRIFIESNATDSGVFLVTGCVFDAKGRRIGFASADILMDMPTGKHYIVAYGTRFDLGEAKRCEIERGLVERDKLKTSGARHKIAERGKQGKKLWRSLEIANRRVKNLEEYLARDAFKRGMAFAGKAQALYNSESVEARARKEKAMTGKTDAPSLIMLGLDMIDSAVDIAAEWAAEPENGAQSAEQAIALIGGAVSGVRHALRALFDPDAESEKEGEQ